MKINVNTQSNDANHGINEPYPFWQVWLAYAFIGPMLGAALLSLPTLFLLLLFPLTWIIHYLWVFLRRQFAACGWRVPKYGERNTGLIYAGVVGAGCTVLWLILITGLQLSFDEQGKFELQSMTMLLFFAVLGGLCAVLLGLFFLPQEPEEIEQMERPEQLKRRRKSSSWYLDQGRFRIDTLFQVVLKQVE